MKMGNWRYNVHNILAVSIFITGVQCARIVAKGREYWHGQYIMYNITPVSRFRFQCSWPCQYSLPVYSVRIYYREG